MYLSNKLKRRIIISCVVIIGVVIGIVIYLNRPGKIIISAEAGTELFIATKKGGEFKKIGTSEAMYSTRKVPVNVYMMATHNGKKTISGAYLERGKTKNLELKLADKVDAKQITTGSVSNVYFNGVSGQGIVPDDYSLINFRTDQYETLRPEFIGLPYMKKIIWYDANNFIYNSFNEGVGRFVNGTAIFKKDLASRITGKGLDHLNQDVTIGDLITIEDISQKQGRPLVLLSDRNIFLSNDRGTSLESIAGFEPDEGNASNFLFSTADYIYRFSADDNTAYEEDEPDNKSQEYGSTLYKYNYKGEELAKIPINDNTLRSVTSKGEKTYILTNEEVAVHEKDVVNKLDLYFNFARDITTYNNKVVLLGDDGLWQVADDGVSIQLLYEFKDSGVGLAQSFSISGDNLIFGTQPRPDDTKSTSRMFSTRL